MKSRDGPDVIESALAMLGSRPLDEARIQS
jgi:hypothetical protein